MTRKEALEFAARDMQKDMADPAFWAEYFARNPGAKERMELHFRDSAPIVAELRLAGFQVKQIYDLRKIGRPYKEAIPILVKWLPLVPNEGVKGDIARCLAVRYAGPQAAKPLIKEFLPLKYEPTGAKWAIGDALDFVADDSVFDEIAQIVQDKSHGRGREMVVLALKNMKNPKAVPLLISLLDDDEVAGHAIMALRKLEAVEARERIVPFLKHPKSWFRQEAKKALAAFDKELARKDEK
jgi:hypothetical protein